ncbi:MAG: PilZ domain-containing protein [Deltaproteobacteria bacterium]|nr:PilZ domain-containing protein [Deltaproteobacteria bacterium]
MATTRASDRRQFPRVRAPVTCRAAGPHARIAAAQQPQDISLGGMRIYASEEVRCGARLELELFLGEGGSVPCTVEVVWVDKLPAAAPARFDVGLRILAINDTDRQRLATALDEAEALP